MEFMFQHLTSHWIRQLTLCCKDV